MIHFSLDKSGSHQNDNTLINQEIGGSHCEAQQEDKQQKMEVFFAT